MERKTVTFEVFEVSSLLEDLGSKLSFVFKGEENQNIKVLVKDGYTVTEIELKHCKEDTDNEDWKGKLKNGFYDKVGGTSELYIKVTCNNRLLKLEKEFLKESPFKMISNNWHEPVDDPQIALWNSSGHIKPQSNTFGKARISSKTGKTRLHSGLDFFALEGAYVYACLDGEIYEKKWHGGYGWTITIKIDNPNELKNRHRDYIHACTTDVNSGSKFKENKSPIYLFYAHLKDIFLKKGDKILAGKKLGLTGISGVNSGTYDPHLHFNIFSSYYAIGRKDIREYIADPALYVYWKNENDLTDADKLVQENRKDEGKKYSKLNYKPILSKID